jgi:hypothetical protein
MAFENPTESLLSCYINLILMHEYDVLGYNAIQIGQTPAITRNKSPTFSGSNRKPSKKPPEAGGKRLLL